MHDTSDQMLKPLLIRVMEAHNPGDKHTYVAPTLQEESNEVEGDEAVNGLDPPYYPAIRANSISVNPNSEQWDEIELLDLPPLISYCSFIKYGWAFGRWLLLICVLNIVALMLIAPYDDDADFLNSAFSISKYYFLSIVWLLTSIWFFWSAKILERNLKTLNRNCHNDEEEGIRTEQNEINNYFGLEYNNIYGRVSRFLDNAWSSSSTPLERYTTPAVSSLVNIAYINWSLLLTASFGAATIAVLEKVYENECRYMYPRYPGYPGYRYRNKINCIMDHGLVIEIIVTGVVLLTCALWIILREGVPSGVVPLTFIPVTISCAFDKYGLTVLIMTIGAIFFHAIICFGDDSRACNLPKRINHEMGIWAIYSFLVAFLFCNVPYDASVDPKILAIVYIVLTAIILEHPLLNLVGFILILVSTGGMLQHYWNDDDLEDMLILFVSGFALIGFSGFLSNIRRNRYLLACCSSLRRSILGRQHLQ